MKRGWAISSSRQGAGVENAGRRKDDNARLRGVQQKNEQKIRNKCKEKGGAAAVQVRAWSLAGAGEAALKVPGAIVIDDLARRTDRLNPSGVPDEKVMVRDILSVWDPPASLQRPGLFFTLTPPPAPPG